MSGFIYAVENPERNVSEIIKSAGLAAILGTNVLTRMTEKGPTNKRSILFAGKDCEAKNLFIRDNQTWVKSLNGRFFIGYDSDNLPTANNLARNNQIDGHSIEINGQKWLIPCARVFPVGTKLPQTMIMTADGLQMQIKKEFVAFSARAEKLWAALQPNTKVTITNQEAYDIAADALKFNYHIGIDEINILGIIDTDSLGRIYSAVIDMPTIIALNEEIKKKQSLAKKQEPLSSGVPVC